MVKPRLEYEVLKWADRDHLEIWDLVVSGTDQEGKPFRTELNFETPVKVEVVVEQLTMFVQAKLRKLPS